MRVVFLHGWSVRNTGTYGGLPQALADHAPASLGITVQHLYLGKYISFADEVTIDDIARGMDKALRDEVLPKLRKGERFACITHSTGGPVARAWITMFYGAFGAKQLAKCPMSHLVMLAPANSGSALAQLGKGKLSRMKFFFQGVEPGVGVLNWLELGSDDSWALNTQWMDHDCVKAGLYPFVLTGQRIDRAFYDNLNSYTGEAGSDGVVRAASANMNYGLVRLNQLDGELRLEKISRSKRCAFGVLPGLSHSGPDMGILNSVSAANAATHPAVKWTLACLGVTSQATYTKVSNQLDAVTDRTQADERKEVTRTLFIVKRTFTTSRYCMFVFRLCDDRGNSLKDYDVTFTASPDYSPNHLPEGFFVDRQRNQRNPGKLTYFVDYDLLEEWMAKPQVADCFGFRIGARPASGYAFYTVAELKGTFSSLKQYFEPNRTLMIDVMLKRHVMEGVLRLTQNLTPEDFKGQLPGKELE